jgi:Domain of unknown function (DUF4124)
MSATPEGVTARTLPNAGAVRNVCLALCSTGMMYRPAFVQALSAMVLAALLSSAAAIAADAPDAAGGTTTYRWVDAQGVVHYSDTPQPGAEKLQIQPAQTYQAPTQGAGANGASGASDGPGADSYRACRIVQPTGEQSLFSPDHVPVSLQLDPALHADDQVTVTFDGQPLQPTDESGLRFRIDSPDRGTHTLAATVRDPSGKVVCSSPPLIFYVQRPSLLSPLAPARGH